ncbi:unnamed protein product [Haemonchus placei]|uniref:IncF plasmid conjugative transfer protein TraD n=1 Tax=Haemonchus placei TaxID=6290 RepID=A0A0N4X206_HAEPC|nr:unnamed protein product [Haemonchus placei]
MTVVENCQVSRETDVRTELNTKANDIGHTQKQANKEMMSSFVFALSPGDDRAGWLWMSQKYFSVNNENTLDRSTSDLVRMQIRWYVQVLVAGWFTQSMQLVGDWL